MRQTGLLWEKDPKTGEIPVLEAIIGDPRFGLSREVVFEDLGKPTSEIRETVTWRRVEEVLGQAGKAIKPVPADIDVPGVIGAAKDILLGEGTSREFAEKRLEEYRKIEKIISDVNTDSSSSPSESQVGNK